MTSTRYYYLYGGAIGDGLLGIHLGRVLSENAPGAQLVLLSTRENSFIEALAQGIPFVRYKVITKNKARSWLFLCTLLFRPAKSVVYEPFNNALSVWWKIILLVLRQGPRSVDVRCQIHPRKIPRRSIALAYDCKADNLFSNTVPRVVRAWGIEVSKTTRPSLPLPACEPTLKPYIVFHFFAGQYRRSIPVDHARELLAAAREKFPQHAFVITCGPGEDTAASDVILGVDNSRVVMAPRAKELLCLLKNAAVCVGTASGVIHMAAQVSNNVVALCNLSDPCWLPYYNPAVVCLSARENCKCNGDKTGECSMQTPLGLVYRCIYDIKTKDIVDAMKTKIV